MKNHPDNFRIKAQAGFSLVEIMVGMVIALLGVIIIFQVFSVSEGIKRTTTSGGDALQNGASALFSLGRSLKMAGYGIFPSTYAAPYLADPASTAPVTITPGAANGSDTILLKYRQSWDLGPFSPPVGAGFTTPPALTFETINVQITGNLTQLVSSTIPDPAPAYATVAGAAAATNVISDGIVLMKAEYGTDTTVPLNGIVDTWSQTAPANVLSVLAVRIVLVARSAQPEVTRDATGNIAACATTTVFPTWTDSATIPLDLSANAGLAAGDSWKCYRYKTFENTVPLRNEM
jgi:type IV pilus assembly protein PilW